MGLDITCYKKITLMDAVFNQNGDPIDPQTREPLTCDYYIPRSNDYHDRSDGIADGVYGFEDRDAFHAGSYGQYNRWRDQLAELAGWPCDESRTEDRYAFSAWGSDSGPFWELINFSDCEGTIGPITSAKLAIDFANHQAKADAHESEYFRQLYGEWRKAFEMAADGGAVSFH